MDFMLKGQMPLEHLNIIPPKIGVLIIQNLKYFSCQSFEIAEIYVIGLTYVMNRNEQMTQNGTKHDI